MKSSRVVKRTKYERACEYCGKKFTTNQPRAKYCTPAHGNADWIQKHPRAGVERPA